MPAFKHRQHDEVVFLISLMNSLMMGCEDFPRDEMR